VNPGLPFKQAKVARPEKTRQGLKHLVHGLAFSGYVELQGLKKPDRD